MRKIPTPDGSERVPAPMKALERGDEVAVNGVHYIIHDVGPFSKLIEENPYATLGSYHERDSDIQSYVMRADHRYPRPARQHMLVIWSRKLLETRLKWAVESNATDTPS